MYRCLTTASLVLLAMSPMSVCRAGNIMVQKDGGNLLIASIEPGSDDDIIVEYANIHRSHIRIVNLNGTIFGRPEALVVASDPLDLQVDLGDGNDTLEMPDNIRFRHVSLDVGAEQHSSRDIDVVDVTLNYTGAFTINTGPAHDEVTLAGVHCHRFASGLKYLMINTGDGPDDVTINDSFFLAPYVFVTTYANGNGRDPSIDHVKVDSVLADNMWFNLGGGDDIAEIRDVGAESLLMNAGGGGDDVAFSYCSISSLNARMQLGNDKLLLFEVDAERTSAHGGDGVDRLKRDGLHISPGGTFTKSGWEYINGIPTRTRTETHAGGVFTLSRTR